MLPTEFVRAVAHSAAAELLRLNIVATDTEIVGTAVIEGVARVVVSLTRDAGPMHIAPEVLARIKAYGKPVVTEVQWQALSVMSEEKATKAEVIAMRCGRKCGGSYRGMLSQLVRMQFITHIKRCGYVLTPQGSDVVKSAPFGKDKSDAK